MQQELQNHIRECKHKFSGNTAPSFTDWRQLSTATLGGGFWSPKWFRNLFFYNLVVSLNKQMHLLWHRAAFIYLQHTRSRTPNTHLLFLWFHCHYRTDFTPYASLRLLTSDISYVPVKLIPRWTFSSCTIPTDDFSYISLKYFLVLQPYLSDWNKIFINVQQ